MKRVMAASALALLAGAAQAADSVTLQLKWVTQAQFAGYYVAKDKGFYQEENLDVEIKPGGPDIAPGALQRDRAVGRRGLGRPAGRPERRPGRLPERPAPGGRRD